MISYRVSCAIEPGASTGVSPAFPFLFFILTLFGCVGSNRLSGDDGFLYTSSLSSCTQLCILQTYTSILYSCYTYIIFGISSGPRGRGRTIVFSFNRSLLAFNITKMRKLKTSWYMKVLFFI